VLRRVALCGQFSIDTLGFSQRLQRLLRSTRDVGIPSVSSVKASRVCHSSPMYVGRPVRIEPGPRSDNEFPHRWLLVTPPSRERFPQLTKGRVAEATILPAIPTGKVSEYYPTPLLGLLKRSDRFFAPADSLQ
jgi:hypothetical protein